MSRSTIGGTAAVAVAVAVISGSCSSDTDRFVVFAASSLAPVTDEIDATLKAEGQAPPEWILAGSQRLVDQILDGAQPQIILTADLETLQPILEGDLGYREVESRVTNRLVVAVAPGNPAAIESLDGLGDAGALIGWCAEQVPCGRLARAVADRHGLHIAADTEEPSARSLARKIADGELDAGLIYRTDAIAFGLETVPDERLTDATTSYGMAVLAPREDQAQAGTDTPSDSVDLILMSLLAGSAIFESAGFEVIREVP